MCGLQLQKVVLATDEEKEASISQYLCDKSDLLYFLLVVVSARRSENQNISGGMRAQ